MKKDDTATIEVQVKPRASRNRIEGFKDGILQVRLTSPPVEGAANTALIKLMAGELRVARGRLEILAGKSSRRKKVRIHGLSEQAVRKAFS